MTDSGSKESAKVLAARWVDRWKAGDFEPPTTPSEWKPGQFFVLVYECMGSPPLCFND